MSPEQVEGRALDARSDLYSLGVTAFFMLAGRPPFEAETPLGVAVKHLHSPPPPLERLRPDIPPSLAEVVGRLLAKQPEDRFGSAAELLAALSAIHKELPSHEAAPVPVPSDVLPTIPLDPTQ